MTVDGNSIADTRMRNAVVSRGISTAAPKQLILRLIEARSLQGELLDFGAGTGDLLQACLDAGRFTRYAGTDLFPRPEHLPEPVGWHRQDLNHLLDERLGTFDVVTCCEVIEHLENPRGVFRNLWSLLKPGGTLLLTTPNCESIRSYLALIGAGHFAAFLGKSYPAHITALLRADLRRICSEVGFLEPDFIYTNRGGIPKFTQWTWQQFLRGFARGRLFSDNLGMVAVRPQS